MSRNYKMHDPLKSYLLSFAVIEWIDVFTRCHFKEMFVEALRFSQEKKGLVLHAWVVMSNHIHLIAGARDGNLPKILGELKSFTAQTLLAEIASHPKESRREWMLERFALAGEKNGHNTRYQFWQQHNQPIELYSWPVIEQKLNYLHLNPVLAGFCWEPQHYPYSSAWDYMGGKGKLDVVMLHR